MSSERSAVLTIWWSFFRYLQETLSQKIVQIPHFEVLGKASLLRKNTLSKLRRTFSGRFWDTDSGLGYLINPIRAGGGGILCPPPQVNFLKYLKNALSYRVETFWIFKWTYFQKRYLVFNCLRPPLVTIATPKLTHVFEQHISTVFMQNLPRTRKVSAISLKGVLNGICCEGFGPNIPPDGVLVTVFVSHHFRCFFDLKMNTTTTMATPMVSFDLVFHKLSEKVTLFTFF